MRHISLLTALLSVIVVHAVNAQEPGNPTKKKTDVHVYESKKLPASDENIAKLKLPDGFRLNKFAEGLGNARIIALNANGDVYVSRRTEGNLLLLRDADGDGIAEFRKVVAEKKGMHGICIDGDTIYLATVNEVYTAPIKADGTLGDLKTLIDDLPDGGQHPNRTLAIGPDRKLYITIGSTCNACIEPNPEAATVLVSNLDGSDRQIFASGLRNTIGIDWHPQTGALWGLDHGIDDLGDDIQPEELNRLEQGKNYGWPFVFADGQLNPHVEPTTMTLNEWREQAVEPEQLYTAHAAPMQFKFYRGSQFPQRYRQGAFATMRGSWNRFPPSGYEVVFIPFKEGKADKIEPFLTGFLQPLDGDDFGQFARLVGLAEMPDGALLIGDDSNGVIYRVSYSEQSEGVALQAKDMRITLQKLGNDKSFGALKVQSTSIPKDALMNLKYTNYGANTSPQLAWDAVEGVKSWIVIMEDPDVVGSAPFVHWLIYNLAPDTLHLPEAINAEPKLAKLVEGLQGIGTSGAVGYFGPRTPKLDPPHNYHFQVFALDAMLNIDSGASLGELQLAMQGHVISAGEYTSRYQRQ